MFEAPQTDFSRNGLQIALYFPQLTYGSQTGRSKRERSNGADAARLTMPRLGQPMVQFTPSLKFPISRSFSRPNPLSSQSFSFTWSNGSQNKKIGDFRDFRERAAIFDHTVRGALSPPHTSRAPGFAASAQFECCCDPQHTSLLVVGHSRHRLTVIGHSHSLLVVGHCCRSEIGPTVNSARGS